MKLITNRLNTGGVDLYISWLNHYSATAHVTAYPNPDLNPNINCIPNICRTYSQSCKAYTSARDYHVTVAK